MGKSITKQFIQQHLPLSILRSSTFIFILVYTAVFPFTADSLFINTQGMQAIKPFLIFWECSVFTTLMLYILLFIRIVLFVSSNIFLIYKKMIIK